MESFSALLALCAENSPLTGEFPAQRPVTRIFAVFFDLRLNKRWSKTREAGDLRQHCAHYDVIVMCFHIFKIFIVIKRVKIVPRRYREYKALINVLSHNLRQNVFCIVVHVLKLQLHLD